jgi:nitroimidazol reductase NimA-like FMN-containing flavoprotein (pyridoxamine 5'-phosphate oxidase superfamily)
MFKDMRRKDKQLSMDEAMKILQNGKYGIMAVVGEDGYPYGVPLHYVMMDGKLYFHSSIDGGHKTNCLKHNPKISFTVIKLRKRIWHKSAIFFGTAKPVSEKRAEVLEKIVEKYVPWFVWKQVKRDISSLKDKTEAYELTIEHLTAKVVDQPKRKMIEKLSST